MPLKRAAAIGIVVGGLLMILFFSVAGAVHLTGPGCPACPECPAAEAEGHWGETPPLRAVEGLLTVVENTAGVLTVDFTFEITDEFLAELRMVDGVGSAQKTDRYAAWVFPGAAFPKAVVLDGLVEFSRGWAIAHELEIPISSFLWKDNSVLEAPHD